VGWSGTNDGATHAFLRLPDQERLIDLGTLGGTISYGSAINDSDQVVGAAYTQPGLQRAFIYKKPGGMQDLNSLIDSASGFILVAATGINASGQITGWGENSLGRVRAFLLIPSFQ
jgi:probable HAF family extracellular repeat protein